MQKTLTIKELPDSERPYEKCLAQGASALSDAELIAAVIRTGSRGERSVDLADRVLQAAPDGVLNLIRMDIRSLMQLHGIGAVKAVQLKCVGELSRRIAAASRRSLVRLNAPRSIADYYMERLRHERKEVLYLAMFDNKSMLIAEEVLSIGTSSYSVVSAGEVYRAALLSGAEYIVLLHNHPSGDPTPSNPDMEVTARISECGRLLGIPLADHIIIGDKRYFSFREENLLSDRKGE